jgi:hypothetical protein
MVKRAAINEAQSQAFTDEQQQRIAQESWDRQLRITDLQFSMADESDPAKRDIIASEIQALDSGVMSVVDRETQSSIEAGRLVPKNDLQSEYGDLGLVFDRPMTAEAARLLAKGKQEEIVRNTIVEGRLVVLLLALLSLEQAHWLWPLILLTLALRLSRLLGLAVGPMQLLVWEKLLGVLLSA